MSRSLIFIIVVAILAALGVFAYTQNAVAPEEASVTPPPPAPQAEPETPTPSPDAEEAPSPSDGPAAVVPEEEEEPVGDPEFHALVTYTDSGFEPQTVTIAQGQTVRFVNQAEGNMWVGANVHPTHALYPSKSPDNCLGSDFDQCEAVPAGNFWEFTFDEVGTHKYHNHVRARFGGSVVVN